MSLPNIWEIFHLKSSPYFQTALQKDSNTKPLSLFVGRQRELRRLLATIGSNLGSRQAVAGRPGLGKTTLVQVVKDRARAAGYWTADDFISITTESSGVLLGQLLAGVYDAVVACNPDADDDPAVEEAQQLVCSVRLRSGTMNVSVAGFGVGGGGSETVSTPPSALILDGPRVLRNLLNYALQKGAKGILLHLNNLENLNKTDTQDAADVLRDIRDSALMLDGLHVIVVGATDVVRTVVNRHPQIRSVFSNPMVLKELTLSNVYELLNNRYQALQIDANQPFRNPVEDSVVEKLYDVFRGDLRGMFKSLEDGMQTLLLDMTDNMALPASLNDLLSVLRKQNREELKEELGPTNWRRILQWAVADSGSIQTRTTLSGIWDLDIEEVSETMEKLIDSGTVEALPKRPERESEYLLTGKVRLATLGQG
ncbi:MAG: ATP-binding protein [Synechococcus sp. SB0666_bin_14]|nr:ATP-binding protein [Synechococcus sp. SB0666_bin_14]MYA91367.1 ATP-binding protein [Synechococcus sp. SB0663_bin_10]MYG46653.1 ATP-binding protein [Synechococcus sp. SB0675_bin_6]MYJ59806.1 ATP-binding protein [Synechococcus sp. SB0672_bin_6]